MDATQLAAAVAQQLSATSVPDAGGRQTSVADAVATIERKANIDDVNRSLLEVNRELALRPTLTELNRVVGEQSLIMESLCSEHLLGRWIWKSGHTKGEKKLVPWNVQNINTNPENFTWEKDKTVIVTAAPGLYEVTFGFFTKRKPQVIALRVEFHTRPHTSHAPHIPRTSTGAAPRQRRACAIGGQLVVVRRPPLVGPPRRRRPALGGQRDGAHPRRLPRAAA